ncbi:MAG: tetratricopeptide repeat protein [Okeania sp. SIO3B3]|nr:tetratricopeptide repeat protein [Okeania sp. SIO3B3]
MPESNRERFVHELAKNEADLNLAYAALLMSQRLTQNFNTTLYLTLLDDIVRPLRRIVEAADHDVDIVKHLNNYLFHELKFVGNTQQYYHPHNSFLNKVIDLRTGIPISLSLIYLELGWRLNLPVWGVGLPGHFIVAYGPQESPIYIDVFNRGELLTEDECMALARTTNISRAAFRAEFLKPVTKRAMLFRMLLNLKQIYVSNEDWESAYRAVDMMLVVRPKEIGELRDRGLIAYRLNHLQAAIFDIQRYLFLAPQVPEEEWLNQHLEMMEDQILRLN